VYIILLVLWIIFNEKVTLEVLLVGFLVCGLIYMFMLNFLELTKDVDKLILKKIPLAIRYFGVLILEIIKANYAVFKLSMSERYDIEPAIVSFSVDFKWEYSKVILANSITLTPGTMTVELNDNNYVVHCLDKSLAEGLDNSVFVELLKEMEEC